MKRQRSELPKPSDFIKPAGSPWTLESPRYWTPEQAAAVYEVLGEMAQLVWCRYGTQIQQVMFDEQVPDATRQPQSPDNQGEPF